MILASVIVVPVEAKAVVPIGAFCKSYSKRTSSRAIAGDAGLVFLVNSKAPLVPVVPVQAFCCSTSAPSTLWRALRSAVVSAGSTFIGALGI